MADRHIICVEPASGRGELVLVQVEQDGTQPLDLRLVGCEGENPYVASSKSGTLTVLLFANHMCYSQAAQSYKAETQVQGFR
jgi:hypothetical protein